MNGTAGGGAKVQSRDWTEDDLGSGGRVIRCSTTASALPSPSASAPSHTGFVQRWPGSGHAGPPGTQDKAFCCCHRWRGWGAGLKLAAWWLGGVELLEAGVCPASLPCSPRAVCICQPLPPALSTLLGSWPTQTATPSTRSLLHTAGPLFLLSSWGTPFCPFFVFIYSLLLFF